ncbi:hypothetical protein [[Clostridium] scindens]|uniref:hypothetical protein n=1 Tax=Clostridium scindens (strain JCM 10418 / VPI 12708) TaxID=29347 RepID=UPI0015715392|nr:hypothetical protein [[Clostridium] scindens]NSI90205.1 hypothetical protein [[Clostridium] scindens]NSJ04778.1 hypothetical protein [[Clostridium] scindens]
MANGYSRQIQERIGASAEGTVFVNSDFADIANSATIVAVFPFALGLPFKTSIL